jgi:hypothetical protein
VELPVILNAKKYACEDKRVQSKLLGDIELAEM